MGIEAILEMRRERARISVEHLGLHACSHNARDHIKVTIEDSSAYTSEHISLIET